MPPGPTVNVITPEGQTTAIPMEALAQAINAGYRLEGQGEGLARAAEEGKLANYEGVIPTLAAGGQGFLRGATLGLSDVVQRGLGDETDVEDLRLSKRAHPIASTVGEVGGAVVPGLLSGGSGLAGSAARLTPAGAVARLGSRVAATAEGTGLLRTAATLGAAGAGEGAIQSAGAYVSDVALENKPLSAEGFLGAMGSGALWGGGAGLALGIAAKTMTSARALFPQGQITKQAATTLEREAADELDSALRDGDTMADLAKQEVTRRRASLSPETQAELERIRVESARAMANQKLATRKAIDEKRIAGIGAPRKARRALEEVPPPAAAPAPPTAAAAGAEDDLLSKLAATKKGIDEGSSLGDLSASARAAEDRAAEVIAKADPEAGRILAAERQLRLSKDEVHAWVNRFKKTDPTEVNVTSKGHRSRGGNERVVRFAPMADDELRSLRAAEDLKSTKRKTLAESVLEGSVKPGKITGPDGLPVTADDILDVSAMQRPGSVDDALSSALRSKMDASDLGEGAEVIGRYEHASAELADALGDAAPPGALRRAGDYRGAVDAQGERLGQIAVNAGEDAARAAKAPEAIAAAKGKTGILGHLADAGAAMDVMQSLGVAGLPDVRSIPVIGPVLSLFFKARAAMAVGRRLGMKIPQTAETVIAGKAAATRQRVAGAIDAMFAGGARAARAATDYKAPTMAAVIGSRLFDDEPPTEGRRRKAPEPGDLSEDYQMRLTELAAASRPGAVRDAVRARIRTSDPRLVDEIVAATERKLAYLAKVAPKSPIPPTAIAGGRSGWQPSKAELSSFARSMEAAEDPAGVLERMAHGGDISIEAAETIREVYPALFAEAQQALVRRVADADAKPLSYPRRVQLSILFDVPLDGTIDPLYVAELQALYAGPDAVSGADPMAMPPQQPPVPVLAAPVDLATAVATDLDSRAAGG